MDSTQTPIQYSLHHYNFLHYVVHWRWKGMQGTIQEALFMFWASQIKENIINELIIFLCFLLQPITGIL